MKMSVFGGRPKEQYYAQFLKKFADGRRHVADACAKEESYENSGRACGEDAVKEIMETYKKAIVLFESALRTTSTNIPEDKLTQYRDTKQKIERLLETARDRARINGRRLSRESPPANEPTTSTQPARSNTSVAVAAARTRTQTPSTQPLSQSQLLRGVDGKLGQALLDEALAQNNSSKISISDVIGCASAKQALDETVIKPSLNPALFSGLRSPVRGILLFGPPGNGKTLLARAVANDSKQFFLPVSAASLMSKWVGDSERAVRALFTIAYNAQPSIIFIDEIDSLLTSRSERDSEVGRRVKTEFLVQMDGALSNNDSRVLVIGATNRPHELDDAVLRRFPRRIMIDLPDEQARIELILSILAKDGSDRDLTADDLRRVARKTDGFSNADLAAVCREAAMIPIRQLSHDQLLRINKNQLRRLQVSDFAEALNAIRPSVSEQLTRQLEEFARRYGQAS